MVLELLDHRIERVSIVDDNPEARLGTSFYVSDLDLVPVDEAGPLRSLEECVERISSESQAVLCDFRLRVKDYAGFNGDELVAAFNQSGVPAILSTTYDPSALSEIRRFRKNIPVLLAPNDLDEESIVHGFETCLREMKGEHAAERRLRRTLVRFEEISQHHAYVVVPGWNSKMGVRLTRSEVPRKILAAASPGFRCHAMVNIGAEEQVELYFENWELPRDD